MNPKDILILQSGRYTDGLIAKYIGLEQLSVEDNNLLPRYSSDMIDAYKIVNVLKELGYGVRVLETFDNCRVEVIGINTTISITDKATELTICKAFLYFLFQGGYNGTALH